MDFDQKKIVVITNIPTPYRIPLFNQLDRQLKAIGCQLLVVFGATTYARRQWEIDMGQCEFDYKVLPSQTFFIGRSESASFTYPGIYELLREVNPELIFVTGYSLATVKLWWRSWFSSVPYLVWSGTIHNAHRKVGFLRTLQRKLLVSRAAGGIAYGSKAKEYLVSLGAKRHKVYVAINTVDTEFFRDEAARIRGGVIGDELLYIGNLTAGKRLDLLIQALSIIAKERSELVLRLIGDGPARESLESMVHDLGLDSRVIFEGFRQREEVPGFLARARCLLFPSEYDVWGLVLVEALAAGVPCIASIHSGATCDLIRDGVTGYQIDFSDKDAVVAAIRDIATDSVQAEEMGRAAVAFVNNEVSLEASAAGFVEAVKNLSADR